MGGTDKKGMEHQKVRSIAEQLSRLHHDLTDATANAEKAVRQLRGVWQGEDAKTFFGTWPTTRHTLDASSKGVDDLAKTLREQIGEQELASGVSGTGGDSDGDGIPDRDDRDDDNDGIPDGQDDDTDNDGTPDDQDSDDDNDGTPDEDDEAPKLPEGPDGIEDPDQDDDGTPDDEDSDDDGDNIPDQDEDPLDEDGDQIPDTEDPDDDNDGTPDEDDPEHRSDDGVWEESGFDDPELNVGATFLDGEKELWDAEVYGHTFGDENGNHVSVEALSTDGSIDGQVGLTKDGLVAAGSLSAGAYLAKVEGKYSNSYGTTAEGKAYVGAEGNADAGVSLGKDGLKAGAGGEVFVGGKAEGSVSQEVGPVDVGVGGEVSYGLGAHFNADAEVSADHVGVDFDLGATLGVGGGIKIDVGVDPTFWN